MKFLVYCVASVPTAMRGTRLTKFSHSTIKVPDQVIQAKNKAYFNLIVVIRVEQVIFFFAKFTLIIYYVM